MPSARRLVPAALALAGVVGLSLATSGPAQAAGGQWGPDGIPYSNGVLCDFGLRTAALVSWPARGASTPAFAATTITGPSNGLPGRTATPAVTPTATAPYSATGSLSSAALAYLISTRGSAASGTTVGTVAALVAHDTDANACVSTGVGGLSEDTSVALAAEAASRSGPYTVDVAAEPGKITLGADTQVTATVQAVSGDPAPGVRVEFAATAGSFGSSSAVTDASGHATATLFVPAGSSATKVSLRADVKASTELTELTAPGAVPLITAAAPRTFEGAATVPIDTTAHPQLSVSAAAPVALPGDTVRATVSVQGMNGHIGVGTLKAYGPLSYDHGCAGHGAGDFRGADATEIGHPAEVTGDQPYELSVGPIKSAGCYLLQASLTTTNAIPAAQASSAFSTQAVLTVAPAELSVTPAAHGVALTGSTVSATVQVSGDAPATVGAVSGTLLGPRPASDGACPTSGWSGAAAAGGLTVTDGEKATVTSGALDRVGCYAFALQTTVDVTGVGSTASRSAPIATALVIAPSLTITALDHPSVTVGKAMTARVEVFGTLTQRGSLQLQLAQIPDPGQGCFGRDYASIQEQPLPAGAPATASTGDGAYRLTTPPVPAQGCWTVVPVLTLAADPSARVAVPPTDGSNIAFTAVQPSTERDIGGSSMNTSDSSRLAITGGIVLALLLGAVLLTLLVARRSSEPELDD